MEQSFEMASPAQMYSGNMYGMIGLYCIVYRAVVGVRSRATYSSGSYFSGPLCLFVCLFVSATSAGWNAQQQIFYC
jgi:hypothetical protein